MSPLSGVCRSVTQNENKIYIYKYHETQSVQDACEAAVISRGGEGLSASR